MSDIRNPVLNAFHDQALRAHRLGGALNVDKRGGFTVDGKNWFGRKALWIKQRLFPQKMRRQNMRVLNALAGAVQKQIGMREAGQYLKSQFGEVAHHPKETGALADRLAGAVKRLAQDADQENPASVSARAKAHADKNFDDFLRPERKANLYRRHLRPPPVPEKQKSGTESAARHDYVNLEKSGGSGRGGRGGGADDPFPNMIPEKPLANPKTVRGDKSQVGEDRLEIKTPKESMATKGEDSDYVNIPEKPYVNFPGVMRAAKPSEVGVEEEHIYEEIPERPPQDPKAKDLYDSPKGGWTPPVSTTRASRAVEAPRVSSRMESLLTALGAEKDAIRGNLTALQPRYSDFIISLAQRPDIAREKGAYLNAAGNFRRPFMEAALVAMLKEEKVIESLPNSADIRLADPQDMAWLQERYRNLPPRSRLSPPLEQLRA